MTQITVYEPNTEITITQPISQIILSTAGPQGPAGTNGTNGTNGQAATISVGTTTTGASGTNASVNNIGTSSAAIFNFTIPRGDTGAQGPSGVIGVDSGELTNTGTSTAAQLGLATAGTAGTYTKVTTDQFGRVTSGTTLSSSDIPTLNQNTTGTASNITGTLAISQGGTGSIYGATYVGGAVLLNSFTKATNNTVPEAVFRDYSGTIDYFNVDANTTYRFDGVIPLNKSATGSNALPNISLIYVQTGSTSTLLEQSAAIRAQVYTASAMIGTAGGNATNTTFASNGTGSTIATTYYITFRGYITTNSTTAGRINIGIGQNVAGSSVAPDIISGAYIQIAKLGTGNAPLFGNWT